MEVDGCECDYNIRHCRVNRRDDCTNVRTHRYRLNTSGRRVFSVAGPTVWHSPRFHPRPDHLSGLICLHSVLDKAGSQSVFKRT